MLIFSVQSIIAFETYDSMVGFGVVVWRFRSFPLTDVLKVLTENGIDFYVQNEMVLIPLLDVFA